MKNKTSFKINYFQFKALCIIFDSCKCLVQGFRLLMLYPRSTSFPSETRREKNRSLYMKEYQKQKKPTAPAIRPPNNVDIQIKGHQVAVDCVTHCALFL